MVYCKAHAASLGRAYAPGRKLTLVFRNAQIFLVRIMWKLRILPTTIAYPMFKVSVGQRTTGHYSL